ncbi:hypothetical protein GIB67_007715 [Kingdonia uniflora]|uniref:Glycosyltransferase n=1 Tax=Kingdonia uniflora TaxID=39325 RepID=A0A7J7N1Z6_9MAGN|nr:hypothetical protein GIB67_007715 [Kingdonia uniflora]
MLKLAELLCLAGLHITFLNTEQHQQRLVKFTDASSRFSKFPSFRFETIGDGISNDKCREDDKLKSTFMAIDTVIKPALRELLILSRQRAEEWPPVTCIIADGLMSFSIDVAKEFGIPNISFRTVSAACFWAYLCIPKLIEGDELPFKDDDLDKQITCVLGMEGFLRRRDLPSFLRAKELTDPWLQIVDSQSSKSMQASAFILNSIEELENPMPSHIGTLACAKVYTIGPLSALLSSKKNSTSSTSLRAVDRSCLTWLDSQQLKSVLYVSFGSIAVVTAKQLLEFWYGIVNSGKPFLWVIRPDSIIGERQIPEELMLATKERGCLVDWSPQEEVLAHSSIGGFLTHSGWNSTLEAITAGVPMLCWPCFADQQINSRYVDAVWKIGLDMKDMCDRSIIERMVRDLMQDRKDEFKKSSEKISNMVRSCVEEGGSSFQNFERLVEDISSMSL